MSHACSPSSAAKNVLSLASELDQDSQEKVAASIIRSKMEEENISDGKPFSLKTFGHPVKIVFGRPENKKDRRDFSGLTFETIKELQLNLDLSKRGTYKLIQTVRKTNKSSMELGIHQKLDESLKCLTDAYSIEVCQFEISAERCEARNLIVLKDVSDFVLDLIKEKGLDPTTATVRVGVDGGGGFFKICVNVFDSLEAEFKSAGDSIETGSNSAKKYLDTGVQRIQFLAIVEDIPETYENVKTILKFLDLESLGFNIGKMLKIVIILMLFMNLKSFSFLYHSSCIAWDLKLANLMLGLSAHGGKHACLYCESEKDSEASKETVLRSFGSLGNRITENQPKK